MRFSKDTNFQQKLSVNVCTGIVNELLIGPFILPRRLFESNELRFFPK